MWGILGSSRWAWSANCETDRLQWNKIFDLTLICYHDYWCSTDILRPLLTKKKLSDLERALPTTLECVGPKENGDTSFFGLQVLPFFKADSIFYKAMTRLNSDLNDSKQYDSITVFCVLIIWTVWYHMMSFDRIWQRTPWWILV